MGSRKVNKIFFTSAPDNLILKCVDTTTMVR